MTDPGHRASTSTSDINPWMVSMLVVAGLAGLIGMILVGSGGDDTEVLVGLLLLGLAGTLIAAWMVCGALTWTPEKSRSTYRPPAADGDSGA